MFSNGFVNMELDMGVKELVVFIKMALCTSVRQTNQFVQPHYPGMGWGFVRSLSALVQGASYYIRVCRTPESRLPQDDGQ
jgi:hypothetical protein